MKTNHLKALEIHKANLGEEFTIIHTYFYRNLPLCNISNVNIRFTHAHLEVLKSQVRLRSCPFFSHTSSIWKLPGQGSNLNHNCNLYHSCINARSLTHCRGPRIKPTPWQGPNLLELLVPRTLISTGLTSPLIN